MRREGRQETSAQRAKREERELHEETERKRREEEARIAAEEQRRQEEDAREQERLHKEWEKDGGSQGAFSSDSECVSFCAGGTCTSRQVRGVWTQVESGFFHCLSLQGENSGPDVE